MCIIGRSLITSPLFSQTLYYNDKRENGTLNTSTYNRNISGMDWTGDKGYNFTCDHLSRLTNATYLENSVGSTKFNTPVQLYGQTFAAPAPAHVDGW